MLAQIAVQAVHLTGGAGEQHLPPLIQIQARLLVAFAHVALHGLGAPETGQVVEVFHGDVADLQPIVQRRAEHHAAALQHIFRQGGEGTAGGGAAAHVLVTVPYSEGGRLCAGLPLLQNGADVGAVAALDAAVRHLRVEEALPIRDHADGTLGTAVAAGGAAGAALMGRQLGRGIQLGHGGYLLNYAYGTILPHGRKKHKCGELSVFRDSTPGMMGTVKKSRSQEHTGGALCISFLIICCPICR